MWRTQLESDGFVILSGLLSLCEIREAVAALEIPKDGSVKGGRRDVLDQVPCLRRLAEHDRIGEVVEQVLGSGAFVVRATLFDKTPSANWKVPWHQDLTIAVRQREVVPGYSPWSVKEGVAHVQPPSRILEHMVTIRLHLDPCHESNGALRVIPGSHKWGRLNQNTIANYVDQACSHPCSAEVGDALVMRPLLLHASSASLCPAHRRVLHFDYAACELDGNLQWRMRC